MLLRLCFAVHISIGQYSFFTDKFVGQLVLVKKKRYIH